MHPIIEAGIMKTRTRPRRTAGRARLVWRGLPDRATGRCGRCASCADTMRYQAGADDEAPSGPFGRAGMPQALVIVPAGTAPVHREPVSHPAEGDSDG
jgi:hypothetical protein